MKKILLFTINLLIGSCLYAQNCTPDPQYTQPGIYPDSATGFSDAYVAVPYTQLVTVIIPVDTCIEVIPNLPCQTVAIDSIVLDSVQGLPPGYTIKAESINNLPFNYPGGVTSCAIIEGTSQSGDEGLYPLTFYLNAWINLGSPVANPYTIDYYSINVLPPQSVEELNSNAIVVLQNVPNPFNNKTIIKYNLTSSSKVSFKVYNLLGEVVMDKTFKGIKGCLLYTSDAADEN